MIPVTKSCHKMGCELHSHCSLFKAEKAQLQIIPQHCGFRCEFYTAKAEKPADWDFPHATDMAGCLE